jgi:hypothetical protein
LSHSSQAQISPPASYSQAPSACVLPSMWQTKFHTHTKQKESYSSVYLNL